MNKTNNKIIICDGIAQNDFKCEEIAERNIKHENKLIYLCGVCNELFIHCQPIKEIVKPYLNKEKIILTFVQSYKSKYVSNNIIDNIFKSYSNHMRDLGTRDDNNAEWFTYGSIKSIVGVFYKLHLLSTQEYTDYCVNLKKYLRTKLK